MHKRSILQNSSILLIFQSIELSEIVLRFQKTNMAYDTIATHLNEREVKKSIYQEFVFLFTNFEKELVDKIITFYSDRLVIVESSRPTMQQLTWSSLIKIMGYMNYMFRKEWDELFIHSQTSTAASLTLEWMKNLSPHLIVDVITYSWLD